MNRSKKESNRNLVGSRAAISSDYADDVNRGTELPFVAVRSFMFDDLASRLWPVAPMMSMAPATPDSRTLLADDTETLEEVLPRVVLYNDDHHTFDEVIDQVCKATGASANAAEAIAWEVHLRGQAIVFEGEIFKCLVVSSILEEIALHTQVLT